MGKRFTYLLAITGLMLLLAHQLVPHCHCPEPDTREACETPHEDFDWLSKIFGTDIGTNHLETFEVVKVQNVTPQILAALQVFVLPKLLCLPNPLLQNTNYTCSPLVPTLLKGHITSLSLRPPPIA